MTTTRHGDGSGLTVLVFLLTCLPGCAEPTRVPLVAPFAAIGTVGFVAGFALGDRIELLGSSHSGTRSATDSFGTEHHGESTGAFGGKIRLGDFLQGRGSVGVRFGTLVANRQASDVQDERLTAFDLAFPVEFYPSTTDSVDHQVGLYAACLVGRWHHFSLTAELNVVHTPDMATDGMTIEPITYLFPSIGLLGSIPFGR